MRLSKLLLLLITAAVVLTSTGCTRLKVPAGYVAIKVNMYGGDRGVEYTELTTGKYWLNPIKEEAFIFPTFKQNYVWTQNPAEGSPNDESITFQTVEGMSCNADIGIAYHIVPDSVSKIFQTYRKGIDEITDLEIRNSVRDAVNRVASSMTVESVYGTGKVKFLEDVTTAVKSELEPMGIIIDRLSLVGNIRIPTTVKNALNQKVEATQRAQQRENELREAEANAAKVEAEARGTAQARVAEATGEAEALLVEARAQAEANRLLSASLTTNLVRYEEIQKWNGVMPTVTGGAGTLMDMRSSN